MYLKGTPVASKASIGMKSYSGFGSNYYRRHRRLSDSFNDHENVNLTTESRVNTHIQAGKPDTTVRPEGNIIAVEQDIYSNSDPRETAQGTCELPEIRQQLCVAFSMLGSLPCRFLEKQCP